MSELATVRPNERLNRVVVCIAVSAVVLPGAVLGQQRQSIVSPIVHSDTLPSGEPGYRIGCAGAAAACINACDELWTPQQRAERDARCQPQPRPSATATPTPAPNQPPHTASSGFLSAKHAATPNPAPNPPIPSSRGMMDEQQCRILNKHVGGDGWCH
jgi:hypothetical protein